MDKVSDYKVESCLFMCGKVHDLYEVKLVKDVTHVEAIKFPIYSHFCQRVPHS